MSERRWGGVVIPITEEGKVLMINNTKDNKGKRERSWFSKEMESVSGYQFPGGAVENGDGSVESGVIREVLEEANLENIDM